MGEMKYGPTYQKWPAAWPFRVVGAGPWSRTLIEEGFIGDLQECVDGGGSPCCRCDPRV